MTPSQPPGARWARSLVPADVGARVVVRHRLADGRLTDALGRLEAWADGVLVVRTRTGTVRVAQEALVAGKRVPPAPPRRGAA